MRAALALIALLALAPAGAADTVSLGAECAGCPQMMVIPAGSFLMGAEGGEEGRPEGPVHPVTIKRRFALAIHEVTQAQYGAFITATGHVSGNDCRSWDPQAKTVQDRPGADWRKPGVGGATQGDHPVSCVSWLDAKAYTGWLSRVTGKQYRLPTEAEWEYAARAGSTAAYPWGDDPDAACGHANLYDLDGQQPSISWPHVDCRDGFAGVAPVGSVQPNGFGLHDMAGNVWEWTEDCYVAPFAVDVPTDGSAYQLSGPCPRRAVRGGSWITQADRNRTAWRGRDPEGFVSWIFGFRVARDLTPAETIR
ncbi:formylglycine-generating enzyme family protein [Polymorphobacter sp.]|uniref:formylglycine-generating enzyme family protein n=1 Tax=Polymorphobacter sp. TaxID=1909290 RepID=UPI003F6FDA3A